MEFSTELGEHIRFVVAADVLQRCGTVGEVLAPFFNVFWFVKVGRDPLTYNEVLRRGQHDFADEVP